MASFQQLRPTVSSSWIPSLTVKADQPSVQVCAQGGGWHWVIHAGCSSGCCMHILVHQIAWSILAPSVEADQPSVQVWGMGTILNR